MTRTIRWTLIALLLLAVAAQGATPVGLLSMVSGNVTILRSGQKTPVPARTADLITAGDRILTGKNSEAAFLFCPQSRAAKIPAGAEVQFNARTLKVLKGNLNGERKVPSCRLPSNLVLASASRMQSGMMRLRGANLLLRSPSRTRIATRHPRFLWGAVDNAEAYEVKLMNREEKILWRQTVTTTDLQYPAEAQALKGGKKYWWRVTAREGEDTLVEAGSFFQVLPDERAEQVRDTESALRQLLQDNPSDNGPRFLLAFLYEEHGMLDEAARVYGQLADRMGPQAWVQGRLTQLLNKLGWDRVQSGAFR